MFPTTVDNASAPVSDRDSSAHTPHPGPDTTGSAPPPRSRPRWLRTAAIAAGAAALIAGGVLVVDLVTNDSASSSVRFDQPIDRLVLDVANGDVEIVGSDDTVVTVEITTHGGIQTPSHHEFVHDGVLTVDADCGSTSISPTCSIEYVVRTPRGVDIVARGSGTDYDLRDLTGDVDMALDGGDVDMQFAGPPTRVRARTDGGDIDISVPAATAHRVVASSDGGSTRVDIATDPDSPYVIDAHANGGDVTIVRSPASD